MNNDTEIQKLETRFVLESILARGEDFAKKALDKINEIVSSISDDYCGEYGANFNNYVADTENPYGFGVCLINASGQQYDVRWFENYEIARMNAQRAYDYKNADETGEKVTMFQIQPEDFDAQFLKSMGHWNAEQYADKLALAEVDKERNYASRVLETDKRISKRIKFKTVERIIDEPIAITFNDPVTSKWGQIYWNPISDKYDVSLPLPDHIPGFYAPEQFNSLVESKAFIGDYADTNVLISDGQFIASYDRKTHYVSYDTYEGEHLASEHISDYAKAMRLADGSLNELQELGIDFGETKLNDIFEKKDREAAELVGGVPSEAVIDEYGTRVSLPPTFPPTEIYGKAR